MIEQGYTHDHIYVLYGDGNDFDSSHTRYNKSEAHPEWPEQITDYNNYKDTIENIFAYLGGDPNQQAIITGEDDLFVWWFGHGANTNPSDPNACSDISFQIENTNQIVSDNEFANYVDQVEQYNHRCFIIITCHSGGIFDELLIDDSTTVFTPVPCNQQASTYCYEELDGFSIFHVEFSYYLFCALKWRDPLGNLINPDADTNDDLRIKMKEVENYIWTNQTHRTNPQFGGDPNYIIMNTNRCKFVKADSGGGNGNDWESAYNSITTALSNASNDDVILVAPGVYNENGISFDGKAVFLRSLKGPEVTIVDGNCVEENSVFIFENQEGWDSILDGFTIQNGVNSVGGGIYSNSSSPTITNCIITGNSVTDNGGGIFCYNNSDLIINNCVIKENTADEGGGGIHSQYFSEPIITNCVISQNHAFDGGGIFSYPWCGEVTINNCLISENSAEECGGGICLFEGTFTLSNCTITDNSTTVYDGGGIFCISAIANITNTLITRNDANDWGGAISSWGESTLNIDSCTVINNTASETSGGINIYDDSVNITNSILWNNSPQEIDVYEGGNEPTITYTDIQGGYSGTGNINENPLFTDPNNGEYLLQTNSPCIDAGDPNSTVLRDIEGYLRPIGKGYDMGAHESFVWYVDPNTIYDAIDFSKPGHTIIMTPGTYDGPIIFDINWYQSELMLGYVTLKSLDPNDPNIVANTIIDGEGQNYCLSFNGNQQDKVRYIREDSYMVKGITMQHADYGIYCSGAAPKIINCKISNNQNGIYCNGGSYASFINCTITENNNSEGLGGGVFCSESSNPYFNNCTIAYNKAVYGGGIFCTQLSSPTLINCAISDNIAEDEDFSEWGGGGGGVYCENSSPNLINCTIKGNFAKGYKIGAYYNGLGGGIYCTVNSSPTITGCEITQNLINSSYYGGGGGIYCEDLSSPIVNNCIITQNSSTSMDSCGGGIYCTNDSSPYIINCSITENSIASGGGGGIFCSYLTSPIITNCIIAKNSASEGSGVLAYNYSSPNISNCTFTKNLNTDPNSGEIDCKYWSSPSLINCILWNEASSQEISADANSIPIVTYSDVRGSYSGTGNINSDPLFVDPNTDYHLQTNSPCIDAANYIDLSSLTDIDGYPRIGSYASYVDMGCYEYIEEIHVYEDGNISIQDAIDAASTGTLITLHPGTYYENITIDVRGIGIRSINPDDPNIVNNTIIDGSNSGIVVKIQNSDQGNGTVLSGVKIQNGYSAYGGGIFFPCYQGGNATITNCIIIGNTATDLGGGIYHGNSSSLIIYNCMIKENSASIGGGFSFDYSNYSSPLITNCVISENTADEAGGGIMVFEGNCTLTNCTISENISSDWGGGIAFFGSLLDIENCSITNNLAVDGGGIVEASLSCTNINNSIIAGNEATGYGGGIFTLSSSSVNINNCTITENSASANSGAIDTEGSSVNITNSILWNDSPQEISVSYGDPPTVTYSDVQQASGTYSGTGNINIDPDFDAPAAGDYHLEASSPCIDTGTNNGAPDTDMDGVSRPQDGDGDSEAVVDMGAYEFDSFEFY